MAVNLDKPHLWKADISASVDMYNDWFMEFAPEAYRTTRIQTTEDVKTTLKATNNLTDVTRQLLKAHPTVLPTLRMSTCPPLAVDRLIGLAGVPNSLVKTMEEGKLCGSARPRRRRTTLFVSPLAVRLAGHGTSAKSRRPRLRRRQNGRGFPLPRRG